MKKFTSIKDITDINELLTLAKNLKKKPFEFKSFGANKTLGLLFFNPSLRTRLSTQKAAMNLGMQVMVMNINADGWQMELEDGTVMNTGSQEHIKEAAAVISQYCDIIGIRTFASLRDKVGDYEEEVLNKFIKYALVPVISLESAILHPLQSFADLITIDAVKTKIKPKVVLTWAPHPKALPQAVANSFVEWMRNSNVDLVIANPEGFDLAPQFTAGVKVLHNQDEALMDADFVYAKNWSSYTDYGKIGMALEHWMITGEKMELTDNGKFMHCLPVRRNVVVSDGVIDSENSLVLQQANNRTYAAQAVLLKLLQDEK
ncbi:N-acetylornithine carbamoyltransferase [Putridiphycobacter roseus]|uniref:N-succinylornithine carbamoyltransferase n=1 Tax=Putridiphycobacter roseus TaxID=2219161 RepID=A0A2W1NEY3_9FLAO|nr:N-acetylornithine carbamoyltransferase [Putridiphycobacter roseus]PZE17663.1 N-acetylornithine carbamoyltransferase [Putridiphycobacter roseus]